MINRISYVNNYASYDVVCQVFFRQLRDYSIISQCMKNSKSRDSLFAAHSPRHSAEMTESAFTRLNIGSFVMSTSWINSPFSNSRISFLWRKSAFRISNLAGICLSFSKKKLHLHFRFSFSVCCFKYFVLKTVLEIYFFLHTKHWIFWLIYVPVSFYRKFVDIISKAKINQIVLFIFL